MAKLKETDMKNLFAELRTAMSDENNFTNVMIKNEKKFCLPMDIKVAFIDVGGNNTINHQIARATKQKDNECNTNENDCSVCIDDKQIMAGQDVGSTAYNLYEYINTHDKVKEKYRELFGESYKNTKNAKKYTPLDFAKSCKPEFAEFMTAEFVIPTPPVKSARSTSLTDVVDAVSRSKKALSNLVSQVTSSKRPASTKEKKEEEKLVKDEDLTVKQLKQKIAELENQKGIVHSIIYPKGPLKVTKSMEKQWNEGEDAANKNTKILQEQDKLKEILNKKQDGNNFVKNLANIFRKGGKTRKHKKTKKRRTYRRK